jgi:hypothetical protein
MNVKLPSNEMYKYRLVKGILRGVYFGKNNSTGKEREAEIL